MIDLDFYFNTKEDVSFSEFSCILNKIGVRANKVDHNTYTLNVLGYEAILSEEHGLLNSGDLLFEKYKYQIGIDSRSCENAHIHLSLVSMLTFTLLQKEIAIDGILVLDTQKLLYEWKIVDKADDYFLSQHFVPKSFSKFVYELEMVDENRNILGLN